jgi:hypothetical protein
MKSKNEKPNRYAKRAEKAKKHIQDVKKKGRENENRRD